MTNKDQVSPLNIDDEGERVDIPPEQTQVDHSFFITTAIHYANAAPHLGHAYEGVLTDILARYERGRGRDVFFLSGMDEHGQKNARAAEEAGISPQAFVDENTEKFQDLYQQLNLSHDAFIRTSDHERHWPGAQELWRKLEEAGDLYKDEYHGLYCVGCEAFVRERDLEDGQCPNHGKAPEETSEQNYFFRLSGYQKQLRELIESEQLRIRPEGVKQDMLALLDEGLEDVSFSRPESTIPWGVPVPGDPDQTMYVWCDALANYISALGFGRDDDEHFQKFWPASVHVIGKDIVRFHALYWPAMLLSAGLELPRELLVHGHITSGGKKMSKTLGNVVDPNEYLGAYGSDAFRFYLGREIPSTQDGDFTREKFIEAYNGHLANGVGNLLARVQAMASKYFDGKVAPVPDVSVPLSQDLGLFSESEIPTYHIPYYFEHFVLPEYCARMDEREVHEAARVAWDFSGILDGYITSYEPFKLIKTDEEKARAVIWQVLWGLWKFAELAEPFMPETANEILQGIGQKQEKTPLSSQNAEDQTFVVTRRESPLFQRIDEKSEKAEQ